MGARPVGEPSSQVLLTPYNPDDKMVRRNVPKFYEPSMALSQILPVTSHRALSHEIDVELFTFVERYATNLTRLDLLIYFGRHPSMQLNALEIAKRIGRAARSVQKELDDFVYLGILRVNRNTGNSHYGLTRASATRRAVVRLAREYSSS